VKSRAIIPVYAFVTFTVEHEPDGVDIDKATVEPLE